jgi:hypothetical protein
MSEAARPSDLEALLRRALAPVEPPADLAERLEGRLTEITELAAEELEAWELSAMRDPRNWARPVAAVVIGSAAGTGLVVLRARRRAAARARRPGTATIVAEAAERALREVFDEARRLRR